MAVTTANMVRNPTLSLGVRCEVGTVGASDQPLSIDDGNHAPLVGDPSPALKFLQRNRYAWSCSAEHHPEELMSEGDFMVIEAIIREKQPTCQPLLDLVASVG